MLCSRAASVCRDSDDDGAEHLTVRKLRAVLAVANSTLQVANKKCREVLKEHTIWHKWLSPWKFCLVPLWSQNEFESVGLCAALLDFIRSFAIPLSWHVQPGILRRHGVASPGRRLGALQGAPLAHRSMTCFGFPHLTSWHRLILFNLKYLNISEAIRCCVKLRLLWSRSTASSCLRHPTLAVSAMRQVDRFHRTCAVLYRKCMKVC